MGDNYSPRMTGMAQPNSPANPNPPSGASRIDPNQIPRPLPGATVTEFETRVNGQANLPPVQDRIIPSNRFFGFSM
jgi:hypothetical protein